MKIEQIDPAEHLSDLVKLARLEYGDSEIANPDYLKWQYLDNPAGKAVVVVARADNGELAGQYVVIPMLFQLDGAEVKGTLSLNTLTHPDYRGQGLFTKMANHTYEICAQEGLALTLGFPNKNSYPGFVRKLKFRHIGNARVMFRLLSLPALVKGVPCMKKAPKYAPSTLSNTETGDLEHKINTLEVRRLDFEIEGDRYQKMLATSDDPKYSVLKSAGFCRWRFQAIPTREYDAFAAYEGGEVRAACVTRSRRVKGLECVFLLDFKAERGERGVAAGRGLLTAVLQKNRDLGVTLAGMMVNANTPVHKLARSLWFREMPKWLLPHDAPVILRRNGSAIPETIFELDDWALSFGDYDVF